ncbi:TR10B factor, partial [Trogon melanurus]|nr:TR10B factor [Trogon melanurus]
CSLCKKNEFIEYPNDFLKCLGCRMCREDQVELSACRADRDTQCACRNGTFCSPDHPCEMCQKCRPRCSNNEVELAPCTPHSDRQCGPPTSTQPTCPVLSTLDALITFFVVVGVLVVLVVLVIWIRYCCRPPGEHRVRGNPRALTQALPECGLGGKRDLPGGRGITAGFSSSRGRERPETLSFQEVMLRTSHPSEQPRRNLVPVPGIEPHNALRCSFDTFAQAVLCQDWRRFARALGLLENEISCAEMNNRYSLESFFQMLNTWLNKEGMNASVNTLLDTLHELNLRGTAEEISSKLVQKGVFQYESS